MSTLNTSGVRPLAFKLLVRPEKVEERTKGGVFIPDQTRDRDQQAQDIGVIVDIGPGVWDFLEARPAAKDLPKVGDRVIFPRYAGFWLKEAVTKDGQPYRLIEDKSVTGWLPEEKPKRTRKKATAKLEVVA